MSGRGAAAESRYRAEIVTARAVGGRASYDAARAAWCEALGLEPDDGVYLGELRDGALTMPQIVEALRTCGHKRSQTIEAIARLLDLGLVEAAPRPSTPRPRAYR